MYEFITNSNLSLDESKWDSPNNPVMFDIYSILHIFFGILSYLILHTYLKISIFKSFIISNILHLLYELKDFYYGYIKNYSCTKRLTRENSLFKHGYNSYLNSITDQLVSCFGFFIAYIIFKFLNK